MNQHSTTPARAPREAALTKDADKLIRRLSLVAYLLSRQGRPTPADDVRRHVEGYPLMTDDAFKRRFHEDRAELRTLGIDVRSQADESGVEHYSLPPSCYYLPDIQLTREELLALGTCLLVLEERFAYSRPLRLALLSLAQGRPEVLRQQETPPVAVLTQVQAKRVAARLPKVQAAIADRKTLVFDYYAIGHDEVRERTVDPYGLLLVGDDWYLLGHCHLRGAVRTFRLSRIRSRVRYATRRPHDFRPPTSFSLSDYRDRPSWLLEPGEQEATVRVTADMAWWVEAHYGHCGRLLRHEDGSIDFVTRYSSPRPLVGWTLGLGEAAEIVGPPALREMALADLERLADRLATPPSLDALSGHSEAATPAHERRGGDWKVDVDRFTRLTTLANYLIAHCGADGEARLPVHQVCEALATTPAELRNDVRVLNLVNFGGDGSLLFAEFEHRMINVICDLAGPAMAAPARLSPLQADTLLLAVDLVGAGLPSISVETLRAAAAKITAARHGPPPSLESGGTAHGNDAVLVTVNTAIREHRALAIEYWSEGRHEQTQRVVEPHMLVQQRGEWYYVSYCRRAEGIRTFRVATTKSASLLDDRFTPRPHVQLDLYRREGIPGSASYTSRRATLWSSAKVARWISERQSTVPLADGSCLSQQPFVDEVWLVHHILRFGGEAVPLQPASAVAALSQTVAALAQRYRTVSADA